MTQETYNIIVRALQNGVPALAGGLIQELNELLQFCRQQKEQLENKETKGE